MHPNCSQGKVPITRKTFDGDMFDRYIGSDSESVRDISNVGRVMRAVVIVFLMCGVVVAAEPRRVRGRIERGRGYLRPVVVDVGEVQTGEEVVALVTVVNETDKTIEFDSATPSNLLTTATPKSGRVAPGGELDLTIEFKIPGYLRRTVDSANVRYLLGRRTVFELSLRYRVTNYVGFYERMLSFALDPSDNPVELEIPIVIGSDLAQDESEMPFDLRLDGIDGAEVAYQLDVERNILTATLTFEEADFHLKSGRLILRDEAGEEKFVSLVMEKPQPLRIYPRLVRMVASDAEDTYVAHLYVKAEAGIADETALCTGSAQLGTVALRCRAKRIAKDAYKLTLSASEEELAEQAFEGEKIKLNVGYGPVTLNAELPVTARRLDP